jgi:hypothetical protein
MLLKLLRVLVLSKEVILDINLYNGCELDKALVKISFLNLQSLYRKGSP